VLCLPNRKEAGYISVVAADKVIYVHDIKPVAERRVCVALQKHIISLVRPLWIANAVPSKTKRISHTPN
jgi:hypothetical protein